MLKRSLGASSFAEFWRYWNPIFGYYLGNRVYRPLRETGLPRVLAVIGTFLVSGAVHDVAAAVITQGVVFTCTPFFFLLSLGVVAGNAFGMDSSKHSWSARATINGSYVLVCLAATLTLKSAGYLP
ncbi:MAG: MBOAT family O-acyltransferase [Pseudomonadota bacterium]